MSAGARAFWWIAPYAAWMIIMAVLPQNAVCYAIRGVVTAILLVVAALKLSVRQPRFDVAFLKALAIGAGSGIAVFLIWIAPEACFGVGERISPADSPYSPETCGMTLTLVKLAASSFVIPVAEEMFFRKWLVGFAGFWWMVALFAVEHSDRWHVGAITGVVYGVLAKRYGLMSAIIAHIVTNFVLGSYVIVNNEWRFW